MERALAHVPAPIRDVEVTISQSFQEVERKAAKQLLSSRWKARTTRLLRVCHLDEESFSALPPIYAEMAGRTAKQDRATIQLKLDMFEEARTTLTPVCTPSLASDLGALVFAPGSADDIERGLSIFAVCQPDYDSADRAGDEAQVHDDHMNGILCYTRAERIAQKAAHELRLPTDVISLDQVLRAYYSLLVVALGATHAVVLSYGVFLEAVWVRQFALHHLIGHDVVKCAGVLRFIQLEMYFWFTAQGRVAKRVPPPDFMRILRKIEYLEWTPAPLPVAYNIFLPSGNQQMLPSAETPRSYFRVRSGLLDSSIKVRPRFNIQGHAQKFGPIPTNDAGGEMCLGYHLRGGCTHECGRGSAGGKNDHKRHSAGETARLVAYLNLAGPGTSFQAPALVSG